MDLWLRRRIYDAPTVFCMLCARTNASVSIQTSIVLITRQLSQLSRLPSGINIEVGVDVLSRTIGDAAHLLNSNSVSSFFLFIPFISRDWTISRLSFNAIRGSDGSTPPAALSRPTRDNEADGQRYCNEFRTSRPPIHQVGYVSILHVKRVSCPSHFLCLYPACR